MNPFVLVLGVTLILGTFGAGWKAASTHYETTLAQRETDHAIALANANADALAKTISLQKAKDDALKQAAARQIALVRAAADSRAALDRMQDTTTKAMRAINYSHGACVATATAYKDVFGECSVRLVEVGQKSDGHASDVRTLIQSWPSAKP